MSPIEKLRWTVIAASVVVLGSILMAYYGSGETRKLAYMVGGAAALVAAVQGYRLTLPRDTEERR